MTSLLNENLSHYHLTPSLPSQCLSNTITQTYLAMIYSFLHPIATTSLQPVYDTSKPLPIHPNYNTLYKSNLLPIQCTLPHSRYFTTTLHPLHYLIIAFHMYILAFHSISTTTTLPSLLTESDPHILTILLVGNVDKLTPLYVLTHPWTSFPMASSIDLGESSGGSVRRLRSVTARKKKLSLTLDLLKLTPFTSADPNPKGPIAIRDFPLDCKQLPHRKTAALTPSSSILHKLSPRPNAALALIQMRIVTIPKLIVLAPPLTRLGHVPPCPRLTPLPPYLLLQRQPCRMPQSPLHSLLLAPLSLLSLSLAHLFSP
jgi:hypothetical protein